jgi:hypothetical protein
MIIQLTDHKHIRDELKPHVHRMAVEYYAIRSTWNDSSWYKFSSARELEARIQELIDTCLEDEMCHAVETTGIHVKILRDSTYVDISVTFDIIP